MTRLCAILLISLLSSLPAAGESAFPVEMDLDTPQAIRETNRVLEEEIRLAVRSQTYLLLDLHARLILIKARGLELYRLPVQDWDSPDQQALTAVYRLQSRPPIVRPKAGPTTDQNPIELKDMPVTYHLQWDPPLTIRIVPPATEHFGLWVMSWFREWWSWLYTAAAAYQLTDPRPTPPQIRLTLLAEQAQSLAWSVAEGMPLLIQRTTK